MPSLMPITSKLHNKINYKHFYSPLLPNFGSVLCTSGNETVQIRTNYVESKLFSINHTSRTGRKVGR